RSVGPEREQRSGVRRGRAQNVRGPQGRDQEVREGFGSRQVVDVIAWKLWWVRIHWPAALLFLLSTGARNSGDVVVSTLPGVRAPLPVSLLAVRGADGWRVWWRSSAAPRIWRESAATLASGAKWTRASVGVEFSAMVLAGSGEAWRTRLIIARIDPRV